MTTPSRRERIAELRALHRRELANGYLKMLVAAVAVNTALAWSLMVAVGVLHAEWWHVVPTMGYHTASLVTGLLFLGSIVAVLVVKTARDSS